VKVDLPHESDEHSTTAACVRRDPTAEPARSHLVEPDPSP